MFVCVFLPIRCQYYEVMHLKKFSILNLKSPTILKAIFDYLILHLRN